MLAIVPSVLSQLAAVAEDNAINSNAVVNRIDFWIGIFGIDYRGDYFVNILVAFFKGRGGIYSGCEWVWDQLSLSRS